MKHKRLAAAVLAAALWLTGCGGAAAPAAPAGSGAAAQSTADTAVQTAQKDRITEQFTLEKTIRDEYGITQKLTIHVPQLVCDSPDAAYLNEELAAMYAADFRQYEDSPEIEPQQDEWSPEIYINWDAYWYGDCVSLVVFRYDGGTDPIYSQGWCFDFAAGHKLSVTELLMCMGLDPDAVQQQMLRQAMQTFDRHMAQGGYYEGLLSGGNLASMRMNTLENNQLEDLCLLLPEQNRLVLRGGCSSTAGSGWRQLDVEIPLQAADPLIAEIFQNGRHSGADAVIVVAHRMHHHMRKGAVPHLHIPDIAATLFRGLDLQPGGGYRHVAVPDLHILHAAAHLAADADAVAEAAVAVEHPDVLGRAVDDITLRIFARFDSHRIVAGAELTGKKRAVRGGIWVPAIAVPHTIRFDGTVVGHDLVGVDHVQVPAGTVGKG